MERCIPNKDQIRLRNEYRKTKRQEINHNALRLFAKQEEMEKEETNKEEHNDFYFEDNF
jgi:hypothetical protein